MNKRNVIALILGILCATAVFVGLCLLFAPKAVSVTGAVIVICLSLAAGMLTANPMMLIPLIAGICMLFLPPWVIGMILMVCGIGGSVGNLLAWSSQGRKAA